jgi:hypothetical protein
MIYKNQESRIESLLLKVNLFKSNHSRIAPAMEVSMQTSLPCLVLYYSVSIGRSQPQGINSRRDNGQADPHEFGTVLAAFKRAKSQDARKDMYVTARIESFTCRKVIKGDDAAEKASVKEALRQALERAAIYVDAGADAIMIHSKSKSPNEVLDFLRQFRARNSKTPCKLWFPLYHTSKSLYQHHHLSFAPILDRMRTPANGATQWWLYQQPTVRRTRIHYTMRAPTSSYMPTT